jgi:hypothetical protein
MSRNDYNKRICEVVERIFKKHGIKKFEYDVPDMVKIDIGFPTGIVINERISYQTHSYLQYYEVIIWVSKSYMEQHPQFLIPVNDCYPLSFKIKKKSADYVMWDLISPVKDYDILGHIVKLIRDYNLEEILDGKD